MRDERTAAIFAAVESGQRFDDIGRLYALSAERVRQLYLQHLRHDPTTDKKRRIRQAALDRFRSKLTLAFRQYRAARIGALNRTLQVLHTLAQRADRIPKEPQKPKKKPRKKNGYDVIWERHGSGNVLQPEKPLSMPLTELGLSPRCLKITSQYGILTVEDVHRVGVINMTKYRGFGRKTALALSDAVYVAPSGYAAHTTAKR